MKKPLTNRLITRLFDIGLNEQEVTDFPQEIRERVIAGEWLLVVLRKNCHCPKCHRPQFIATVRPATAKPLSELF